MSKSKGNFNTKVSSRDANIETKSHSAKISEKNSKKINNHSSSISTESKNVKNDNKSKSSSSSFAPASSFDDLLQNFAEKEKKDAQNKNKSNVSHGKNSKEKFKAQNEDNDSSEEDDDFDMDLAMDGNESGDESSDIEDVDIDSHKEALEKLKETDPEFYAYLQKQKSNLLDFGADEGENEDDEAEEDEDEDEEEVEETPRKDGHSGPELLTYETAQSIMKSAFEHFTFKGLVSAAQAFRAAAYSSESADIASRLGLTRPAPKKGKSKGNAKGKLKETNEDMLNEKSFKVQKLHFEVSSPKVFMYVVQTVLRNIESSLIHHLGEVKGQKAELTGAKNEQFNSSTGAESNTGVTHVEVTLFPNFDKVFKQVKGLIMCLIHLIESSTSPSLVTFLLHSMRPLIPFLVNQGSLTKKSLRAIMSQFQNSADASVKMQAYLRIRQVALALPYPTLDHCIKGMYLAFVKSSKFMNEQNASNILLMSNCISDICMIDEVSTYQHAFIYTRQLAIHLRTALTTTDMKKKKEATQNVLSWQFFNCLRLWVNVVSSAVQVNPDATLTQLVYPLVQLTLGLVRLQPGPRYLPLRLHACAMLNDLAWASNTHIPTVPLLLEVLTSPVVLSVSSGHGGSGKKGQAEKAKEATSTPSLSLMIKAGQQTLQSRILVEAIISKTLELLTDAVKFQFQSIAFPEFSAPLVVSLRKFAHLVRLPAFRARVRALLDAVVAQGAKIVELRTKLAFSPTDTKEIEKFQNQEFSVKRAERIKQRAEAVKTIMKNAQELAEANAKAELLLKMEEEKEMKRKEKKFKTTVLDEDSEEEDDEDEEEEDEEEDNDEVDDEEDEDEEEEEEEEEVEQVQHAKKRSRADYKPSSSLSSSKKLKKVITEDNGDVVEDFHLSDLE